MTDGRVAVIEELGRAGLVAIFRWDSTDGMRDACLALAAGGAPAVEITLTTPGALDLISVLAQDLGLLVGAGTVLDAATCRAAVEAGARFVVSPGLNPEVVALCAEGGVVSVAGCLTATEVMTANRLGADIVKLFPGRIATPDYLRDLLEPLRGTRMLPTGRVDLQRAAEYIRAGAFAVGAGTHLVDPDAVRARDWTAITQRASTFRAVIDNARGGV